MRRWIISQIMFVVIVVVIGQIGKSSFVDSGAMGLKTAEEAFSLESGVDYVFLDEDYDGFVKYEKSYIESVDTATLIVLGSPTGNIIQKHFSLAQEVKIEKVIKGDTSIVDTSAYIYGQYGFAINEDLHKELTYYSVNDLMQPGHQYLMFLTPLELNDYLPRVGYRFIDSFFSHLDLSDDSTTITTIPLNELKYTDVKGKEIFASSERMLDQLKHIKKEIIGKYIPDRTN